MKKYLSRLTFALVVALVMSVGVAIPAMAAENGNGPTALTPVEVGITKELNMPWGTTTPAATFNFQIRQLEYPVTGLPDDDDLVYMDPAEVTLPSTGQMNVVYAAGAGPNRQGTSTDPYFSDVRVAVRGSGPETNILANVVWPRADLFSFEIREVVPTASTNTFADYEFMTYDVNIFVLTVRTAWCPVAELYLPVQSFAWPGFPGTDGYYYFDGKLTHIRPGQPGQDPGSWVVDPSEIRFVNNFYRETPRGGDDPDYASFALTKQIRQTQENDIYADPNLYFSFDTTLTIPAVAMQPMSSADNAFAASTGTITVTGFIIDENDDPVMTTGASPVQRTVTFTGTPVRVYYTPNEGTPVWVSTTLVLSNTAPIELRHNQTMIVPTLPAGTIFEVTELQDDRYYVYDLSVYVGGIPVPLSAVRPGGVTLPTAVGADVTVGPLYIIDIPETRGGCVTFMNAFRYVPITGLIIGSMPFLVGLIAATLVLAMMVSSRSRKRIEQLPVAI